MWELDCEEGWAPKNWWFELWCWRRLLRVPWTARRSNQSILKEISPGISLEGMMLKLKLQYSGHLMRRVDSLEKTLMLGGIGDRRRRDDRGWDCWMTSLTRWMWVWMNSGRWWWTGRPGVLRFMGSQRVRGDWATELNWTVMLIQEEQMHVQENAAPCCKYTSTWKAHKDSIRIDLPFVPLSYWVREQILGCVFIWLNCTIIPEMYIAEMHASFSSLIILFEILCVRHLNSIYHLFFFSRILLNSHNWSPECNFQTQEFSNLTSF